jgi:uncharacterized protein
MNFVKLISIIVCFYCGIVFAQTTQTIKSLKPTGFYNNFSKQFPVFLNKEDRTYLESLLISFSKSGFGEIAIVVVDDYQGMEENAFATELFNHFQIGKKGKSNGVLLLIKPTQSPPGRRIYISTGYGAEALLTDSESKLIIENLITPQLKQGKNLEGIIAGVQKMENLLSEGVSKTITPKQMEELDSDYMKKHYGYTKSQTRTGISKSSYNAATSKGFALAMSLFILAFYLIYFIVAIAYRFLHTKEQFIEVFGGFEVLILEFIKLPFYILFSLSENRSRNSVSFGSNFGGFGGGSSGGGGAGGGW